MTEALILKDQILIIKHLFAEQSKEKKKEQTIYEWR